jgi:tetratricopeptide (TPR) repeat protein
MAQAPRDTEQQVAIHGANNIVLQIEGDRNTVNLKGFAHLTLTRYLTRRHIESDADLLSPYSRSIPLIGREREMAALRAWLASDRPISVRVLTGRAGAGKTRLALELCEALLDDGWDAGFVESGELVRFRSQQNLSTWGWQRPTLLVIDYAAVHAERLSGWLKELSDHQGRAERPLRLLLLERHAEAGSGWWQTAFGRGGWGAKATQKLLYPPDPVPVEPITDAETRREVLRQVLSEKGAGARPPAAGADPGFDEELENLDWGGEPLFLMMAGVMAADRDMGQVLSLGRTDLAFALAERELNRIAEIAMASGIDRDFLPVMAGYVTLCRGLDKPLLLSAVEAQKAALALPGAGDPGKVAKVLCEALPGDGGAAPILPDMIGEAATLCAFDAYDDRGTQAVQAAFAQAGEQVAASVIRAAQDFTAAGRAEPLAWLDALVERDEVDVEQLMLIANTLPQNSLALREHAARLTQKVVDLLRQAVDAGDTSRLPLLVAALNNLGYRLSEVGRRAEALAPAQEAAELYRALAEQAPDVFRPDLAGSLNNLANRLSEVGRRAEALAPAQEAVDIRRALAEQAPDVFRPDLALSLSVLADRLEEAGRLEDAIAADEEAVLTMAPTFLGHPQAWSGRMIAIARDYLRRGEALGREPNAEMLGPVLQTLRALQAEAGQEDT